MRRWAWHFLGFRDFAESTIYGFYICGGGMKHPLVFKALAAPANSSSSVD